MEIDGMFSHQFMVVLENPIIQLSGMIFRTQYGDFGDGFYSWGSHIILLYISIYLSIYMYI